MHIVQNKFGNHPNTQWRFGRYIFVMFFITYFIKCNICLFLCTDFRKSHLTIPYAWLNTSLTWWISCVAFYILNERSSRGITDECRDVATNSVTIVSNTLILYYQKFFNKSVQREGCQHRDELVSLILARTAHWTFKTGNPVNVNLRGNCICNM